MESITGLLFCNQNLEPQLKENMEDQRNILFDEKPFSFKLIKDSKAQIFYKSKIVTVIQGKEYNKLKRVIEMDNIYELQLFLAKITGQFKKENEK
ncbi:MAG TPA: hypothetical protein VJ861_00030 [Treponemataceae bacterium]|nr:hypothetical protein [Treponemataceae bacterium]